MCGLVHENNDQYLSLEDRGVDSIVIHSTNLFKYLISIKLTCKEPKEMHGF